MAQSVPRRRGPGRETRKETETANHAGNGRGVQKERGRGLEGRRTSEAEEGPERVKEEKAEGGERRRRRRRHRWKGASRGGGERGTAKGRDFKRNQFRVAVQSNVTPAAAGVNVGRNSNFTLGPLVIARLCATKRHGRGIELRSRQNSCVFHNHRAYGRV